MRGENQVIDLNDHVNQTRLVGKAPEVELGPVLDSQGREIPFARAVYRLDSHEPISVVSQEYTLVPHNRILEAVDEAVGELGLKTVPRGVYFFRRGAVMRALYKFPELEREITPADSICPLVRIGNSYDRTSRVSIEIGAFRFACTNLAIGGEGVFASGFRSIHSGQIEIGRVQSDLAHFLAGFEKILETFQSWRKTPWTLEHAEKVREAIREAHAPKRAEIVPLEASHRFEAYNRLTDYATHRMRTAQSAFRFLDLVNSVFQSLN